eukprot:447557_1
MAATDDNKQNDKKHNDKKDTIDIINEIVSVKELNDCNKQQMLNLVNIICNESDKLISQKQMLIIYFEENNIDGIKFKNTSRSDFGEAIVSYYNNKKLRGPSMMLFKALHEYNFSPNPATPEINQSYKETIDNKSELREQKYSDDEFENTESYDALLNTMELRISTVFASDNFAKNVRVIVEENHENIDEVLDGLDMIIDAVKDNTDDIKWDENIHPKMMNDLLVNIFIQNNDNINNTPVDKLSKDDVLNIAKNVCKQINEFEKTKIDINKVQGLIENENINGIVLQQMDKTLFKKKAKQYKIFPKKATKVYDGIMKYFEQQMQEQNIENIHIYTHNTNPLLIPSKVSKTKQITKISKIEQIDEGLCEYYKLKGQLDYLDEHGVGKFKKWCQDQGYDSNLVDDELNGPMDECMFINFDRNFPIDDQKQDNSIEIFNIIKKCFQKNNPFLKVRMTEIKSMLNTVMDDNIDINMMAKYASWTTTDELHLRNDIIITNRNDEHFIPALPTKSKIHQCDLTTMPTIYDVWTYCYTNSTVKMTLKESEICNKAFGDATFYDMVDKYEKQFPGFIETQHINIDNIDENKSSRSDYKTDPQSVIQTSTISNRIEDNIIVYHFYTIAMSHVLRTFDKLSPIQITMAIIVDKVHNSTTNTSIDILKTLNDNKYKKNRDFVSKQLDG